MFSKISLIASALFSVSCLLGFDPELRQMQRDKVFFIKDIINLKCQIKTGNRTEQEVPFTNALSSFNLEIKQRKSYTEAKEEPVTFKYKDPKDKKTKTGWINNLGYVPIKETNRAGRSPPNSSVKCINLISKGIHPLLRARSNYTYQVRFQVIGGFVRVLLVAPYKDIPSSAIPYSLKLNKGFYAMPIGGYSAPPVDVEALENSDREDTNNLFAQPRPLGKLEGYEDLVVDGIPHNYPKGVKYVQVASSGFQPYKSLVENSKKIDVYPKDFFRGEWFWTLTPIQGSATAPYLSGGFGQSFLSRDSGGLKARTVSFEFEEKFLVANSANKEKSEKPEHETRSVDPNRWVLKIPIKHKSYNSKQTGKDLDAGLQEVTDERVHWKLRPWAAIKFNGTKTFILKKLQKYFPFFQNNSFLLEELTFSSDYFSFLIKDQTKNHSFRFSFLRKKEREKSSYVPVYLSQEMLNLFPPFVSTRRIPRADHILQSEHFQKRFPVNRFHISTAEPIRYYISDLTPKEEDYPYVHNVARESINIWNQVFKKADVPCPKQGCFVLEEEKIVPLGDIRYNVFNFIDPRESSGSYPAAGYGPSISDYQTGEILSATANINTLLMRENLIHRIHKHIQRELGMTIPFDDIMDGVTRKSQKEEVFLNQRVFLPEMFLNFRKAEGFKYSSNEPYNLIEIYGFQQKEGKIKPITSLKEALSERKKKELNIHYELITGEENPPKDIREAMETVETHNHGEGAYHHCDLQSAKDLLGDRIYSLIDALCGESLSLLIPKMREQTDRHPPSPHEQKIELNLAMGNKEVKKEILNCADKLLSLDGLDTAIHEQGHNISMRHQFAGSSDKENFLSNEDFSHDFIFSHLEEKEKKAALKLLQPESASIMDYTLDSQISPGAYDVAFARFYYAGKAESENGEIVKVDFEKPIDKGSLKKYRVCEDTRASFSLHNTDIFCNRFDKGATPLDIVENYYNFYIDLPSERASNRSLPRGGIGVIPFFKYTLKIYQKWRREIADRLKGAEDSINLSKVSRSDYETDIRNILKANECNSSVSIEECLCAETALSEEQGKNLRNLYCAKQKIINAFHNILLNVQDLYCEIQKGERTEWIPFSEIHGELAEWDSFSRNVSSCFDVEEIFENTGWKLKYERGYPLLSGVFSTNKNNVQRDTGVDYRGSSWSRILSGIVLGIRFPLSKSGAVSRMRTTGGSLESSAKISFMDEPDFQFKVKSNLIGRITKGIKTVSQSDRIRYFYNFKNEAALWQFLSHYLLSIAPAANPFESLQNLISNQTIIIDINRLIKGGKWSSLSNFSKFFHFLTLTLKHSFYFHDILPEPTNQKLYTEPRSFPLVIKPRDSSNSHIKTIINALNDIALTRSFEIFYQNFLKFKQALGTETPKQLYSLSQFENSLTEDIKKEIINPVRSLIVEGASYQMPHSLSFLLAYSLLSDYLIDGTKFDKTKTYPVYPSITRKNPFFLTNHVVEIVQSGLVTKYIIGKAFFKKCKEVGEFCPSFQLPENLSDPDKDNANPYFASELTALLQAEIRKNFSAGKIKGAKYFSAVTSEQEDSEKKFNLFQSYLTDLKDFIHSAKQACATTPAGMALADNPEQVTENADSDTVTAESSLDYSDELKNKCDTLTEPELQKLLLTLFELEAFKAGQSIRDSKTSEVNTALLSLLETLNEKSQEANGRQITEIEIALSYADKIREGVKKLETLSYFPNSRFLRELFFISVFEHNPLVMINVADILQRLYTDLLPFLGYEDYSSPETTASPEYNKISESAVNIPLLLSANFNSIENFIKNTEEGFNSIAVRAADRKKPPFFDSIRRLEEMKKTVSFAEMLNKLFEDLSANAPSTEREGNFKVLFQNRITKELSAQEDILIFAIEPGLSIGFFD